MTPCEWNPAADRLAWSTDPEHGAATVSLRGYDGGIHLCAACAALPRFRRFKQRPLTRSTPMIDGLSPDDSTPETRRWERWAATVRVHDLVRAAGRPGVVTALTDDFVFVRLDGRDDAEPFEWADVDVYP